MTTRHQETREEEAYWRLFEESWETLSEPARAILREAHSAAEVVNMVHGYCGWPEDYEKAMEKMHLAATEITEREHKLLAKLWRAALAAAASIDSEDFETLAGYRVYSGNLHWCYRTCSGMIEKTLQERRETERQQQMTEREPEDFSDIPF